MTNMVVGIGGAGTNIVVAASQQIPNTVRYMVANTDAQSLRSIEQHHPQIQTLLLGPNVCQGQPTAGAVSLGYKAVIESHASIKKHLAGAKNLVVVAGLGGGTGTGAVPTFAKIGVELCPSVSAVVVEPFTFEGSERQELAEQCVLKLKEQTAKLFVVDNEAEKNIRHADQNLSDFLEALNARITNRLKTLLCTELKKDGSTCAS